jgi:hypothetical protein
VQRRVSRCTQALALRGLDIKLRILRWLLHVAARIPVCIREAI